MFRTIVMCCLSYLAVSNAGVAPFIVPCKLDDETCMVSSAQKALEALKSGIKELGIDGFESLYVDTVNADNGDLKLVFEHLNLSGLSKCKFLVVRKGNTGLSLDIEIECPFLLTGQYTFGPGSKIGSLLAIEGAGDCEMKTDKIQINLQAILSTITGSDGQEHWHIDSLEYTVVPKEQVYMKWDKLFYGDEEKATPIITFMDVEWKNVVLKVGGPIFKAFIQDKCKGIIEKLLENVPANELYIA